MKKSFKLDGIDCANCAAKIERAINKIDGIENAVVNFMTTKLTFDVNEEKLDAAIKAVELAVKKTDPSIEMKKA